MTKLIPILSGRCLVVELPEGAKMQGLQTTSQNAIVYADTHGHGVILDLPPGNWRIIGMLSEVRDAELADVTGFYYNKYNERYVEMPTSAMRATPIGDVEDAILAEGWYFENPVKIHTWASENADDYRKQWEEGKKRILDRSRCLLLAKND